MSTESLAPRFATSIENSSPDEFGTRPVASSQVSIDTLSSGSIVTVISRSSPDTCLPDSQPPPFHPIVIPPTPPASKLPPIRPKTMPLPKRIPDRKFSVTDTRSGKTTQ